MCVYKALFQQRFFIKSPQIVLDCVRVQSDSTHTKTHNGDLKNERLR